MERWSPKTACLVLSGRTVQVMILQPATTEGRGEGDIGGKCFAGGKGAAACPGAPKALGPGTQAVGIAAGRVLRGERLGEPDSGEDGQQENETSDTTLQVRSGRLRVWDHAGFPNRRSRSRTNRSLEGAPMWQQHPDSRVFSVQISWLQPFQ